MVGRSGTRSRLRIAKPPRGAPNNGEYAWLRAGNLLYDPGLELYVGNAVGSYWHEDWDDKVAHHHYALPRFDPARPYAQYWPDGSDVAYWDIAQWMQHTEPYVVNDLTTDSAWHVTRVKPYLGDFHLTWWDWQASARYGGNGVPGGLCIQAPGLPPGYAGRAQAGDKVTWSVWSMVTDTQGSPQIVLFLYFFAKPGAPIVGVVTVASNLTTSYAEYTVSASAPGNTYFIRCGLLWTGTGARGTNVYVDTGTLSVE